MPIAFIAKSYRSQPCTCTLIDTLLTLTSSAGQGNIFKMGAIFISDWVSRTTNESTLKSWATKIVQPCPSGWWSLEETIYRGKWWPKLYCKLYISLKPYTINSMESQYNAIIIIVNSNQFTHSLTLALQLFRIAEWRRLSTLVDDKPPLHHLNRSCHHTLSPIDYCNRPPVCQRSLLFGLSCLPASGLHLKGLNSAIHCIIWLIRV